MSKSRSDEWYEDMLDQVTSRFENLLKGQLENNSEPIVIDNQIFQDLKPFLLENIFPMLGIVFPNVLGVDVLKEKLAFDFSLWLGKKRPEVLSGMIKMFK